MEKIIENYEVNESDYYETEDQSFKEEYEVEDTVEKLELDQALIQNDIIKVIESGDDQRKITKDNDKKTILEDLLLKLNLERVNVEKTNRWLILLLTLAERNNNITCIPAILTRWSQLITGFDEYEGPVYPILATLFRSNFFPLNLLELIHKAIRQDVTMIEIALDIFDGDGGEEAIYGLNRLFNVFGRPDGDTFTYLYNQALASDNSDALEFISSFQSIYREPAETPKYIINPAGEGELWYEEELLTICDQIADEQKNIFYEEKLDDLDFLVDFLTDTLHDIEMGVGQIEFSKEEIRKLLENKNNEERKALIEPFNTQRRSDELNDNKELFSIVGPSNALLGVKYGKVDHVCFKYGGCRMYFCNCFEQEDENDDYEHIYPNIPTWFKGRCETCGREISKRIHAVRKPLSSGGWKGTFCSMTCLRKSESNSLDEMTKILMNRLEDDLNNFEIWDRYEIDVEDEIKKLENTDYNALNLIQDKDKLEEELYEETPEEETEDLLEDPELQKLYEIRKGI
jgi:hypothetical protein